jgi:hypothetical protein
MTEPAKRTQPPRQDEYERPAPTVMSERERGAIRRAGAADAQRSRARQGPTERIEDPATVAVLVAITRRHQAKRRPRKVTHSISQRVAETITATVLATPLIQRQAATYTKLTACAA